MNSTKPKRCRAPGCREMFEPRSTFQIACSPRCAIAVADSGQAKANLAKAKRGAHREAKAKLKSRTDHLREAQAAFNAFIRERDYLLPCVSCGLTATAEHLTGSGWDAGHYRSTGANPELRFEEHNCWKQCVKCNQHLSGNTVNYRVELLNRIGPELLAWLEGPHPPKKYTTEDLIHIKARYRAKARELKRRRTA